MTTAYVVVLVLALVVLAGGALLWTKLARQRRSLRLREEFGPEYERTVLASGGARQGQRELEQRQKHVAALSIRPLSASERERSEAEWASVQSRFVDEPGQAIVDADRLIQSVMQLRAYPVAEFEQRAADISVSYPALVSDYRAARAIAVRNEQHQADTEELRQALIHYRSLFEELVGTEAVPVGAHS
jgi:hypothetical protein